MKKRLFAMTLAGILAASCMAGCGSSSESGSDSSSSSSESTDSSSSDESYNISFIVKHTDGHFNKVMAGAKAYTEEHPNVSVDFLSPTSSTAYDEQINMIETSLGTESVDALVIAPLQSDSTANLVSSTDKVVVALDTDFTSDKKSTFVGTGNEDAAYSGGKAAAEAKIAEGVEKPTAVILTGVQGDETHEARLSGFTKGIEEAGGEVLEVQYCDCDPDKAATATEAVIQKYQDGVDIIVATDDNAAMASLKAVQDSGGENFKDTLVCGFDGNQSSLEAIQEGTLSMDVAQEGYQMGYKAMEAAVAALEGETLDDFIDSGSTVVSSDNVEDYIQTQKDEGVWE